MKTTTASTYDQQAIEFLNTHGLTCDIKLAPKQTPPNWCNPGEQHGTRYRVALSHPDRATLRFDFWGSIADAAKGEDPTAYDVLACISSDVHCPETFEDFCGEYGYDEDSRKAEQTFHRCYKFGQQLRAFFPEGAERDALSEIN